MSAYVVDRNVISYIVEAVDRWDKNAGQYIGACTPGPRSGTDLDALGQLLWEENAKSVAYRYDEPPAEVEYGLHVMQWHSIKPVQVLNSIRCLDYQSCEHPEWSQSTAKQFLERLKAHAIDKLPGMSDTEWGAPEPEINCAGGATVRRLL